jgi:hypothetical protein
MFESKAFAEDLNVHLACKKYCKVTATPKDSVLTAIIDIPVDAKVTKNVKKVAATTMPTIENLKKSKIRSLLQNIGGNFSFIPLLLVSI